LWLCETETTTQPCIIDGVVLQGFRWNEDWGKEYRLTALAANILACFYSKASFFIANPLTPLTGTV